MGKMKVAVTDYGTNGRRHHIPAVQNYDSWIKAEKF